MIHQILKIKEWKDKSRKQFINFCEQGILRLDDNKIFTVDSTVYVNGLIGAFCIKKFCDDCIHVVLESEFNVELKDSNLIFGYRVEINRIFEK